MEIKRLLVMIEPPAVTATAFGIAASLPVGELGAAYEGVLAGYGGAGGYTFTQSGLPAGLSLATDGKVTGTPTAPGYAEFTGTVTDVNSVSKPQTISITIKPTVRVTGFLPAAEVGVPYTATLTAAGGTAPYTWSLPVGTLPAGLTQSGDTISGTPTAAETQVITVRATDSAGTPVHGDFHGGINVALAVALTGTFPDAIVGVWYQSQLEVTGGVPPFQFGVTGTFQFNLSPTGLVSGYGMFADSEAPTFTVSDSLGGVATFSPTWDVVSAAGNATATVTTIEREFLGAANGDERYIYFPTNFQLVGFVILQQPVGNCTVDPRLTTYAGFPAGSGDSIAGGTPPAIAAGKEYKNTTLTSWTTFIPADSTMALHLSGLATATNISVTLFGIVPNETVTPVVLSGSLPGASVGTSYSHTLAISGGIPPYVLPSFSPALPAGLSAAVSGSTIVVSGTPTTGGAYSGSVTVEDSFGQTSNSLPIAFTVAYATLTLTGTYPAPTFGVGYSHDLTIAGGDGTYSLTGGTGVSAGTLPSGLALSIVGSALRLSGTPTVSGEVYSFTASVGSGDGQTATSPQSGTVAGASLGPIGTKITSYWDMKENSGSVRADDKSGLNDASEFAGSVPTTVGPKGGADVAADFSSGTGVLNAGTNASTRVDVSSPSTGGSHCWFGWVKWNSGVGTAMSVWDGSTNSTLMYAGFVSSSGYQGYQGGSTYYATTVGGLTSGAWHFFVTWRDAADGKLRSCLDDGTVVVSSAFPTDPNPVNPNSLTFGSDSSGTDKLTGSLSRCGWIKGDFLTPTEITTMFNAGPTNALSWADIVAGGL